MRFPAAPSARRGRLALLGTVAGCAAVLLMCATQLGAQRLAAAGIADPGTVTNMARLLGHWIATLAGAACTGALIWIMTTATPRDDGRIDAGSFPAHLFVERVAILWTCCAT
ncbi:cytochrome c oxidase assembly protein, partial [Mycolicibacterium fortuitum]